MKNKIFEKIRIKVDDPLNNNGLENIRDEICDSLNDNKLYSKVFRSLEGIDYRLHVLPPDSDNNIDFPSVVMFPLKCNHMFLYSKVNSHLVVETCNKESINLSDRILQSLETAKNLASVTSEIPSVIVVPVLPSNGENMRPYYQQLSADCLDDKSHSVDKQLISLIDKVRNMSENIYTKQFDSKVFLNGYSSSGVFAERFALLHPDRVDAACIGGASFEIPVIDDDIDYPLGIKNIKAVSGKDFDKSSYLKIHFDYYVSGGEQSVLSDTRINDNGKPAVMYDMTYMDRSVPTQTGRDYRKKYGEVLFYNDGKPGRAENCINNLKSNDINVNHTIISGYTHNGINSLFSKGDSVNSRYSKGIEHIKKFYNSYYNQNELVKELDYRSHTDEKNSKKEKYYRDYMDEKNPEKEKDDYDFSL